MMSYLRKLFGAPCPSRLAGSCPASGVVMPGDIFRVGREEKTISAKVITAFDEQKLEHKLRSIGASGKEQPGRQLRVLGRQSVSPSVAPLAAARA